MLLLRKIIYNRKSTGKTISEREADTNLITSRFDRIIIHLHNSYDTSGYYISMDTETAENFVKLLNEHIESSKVKQ